jgi:hypothetical protein
MKSLLISSVILLSVIFSCIFGALFTERKLADFEKSIDSAIPDGTYDTEVIRNGVEVIKKEYENIGKFLLLLIHDNEIREIEEHIEDIESAAILDNSSDAIMAKNRLILHIRQLRRLSIFSPEAIF